MIFDGQSLEQDCVLETIKRKSWLWLDSYVKQFKYSFFEYWHSNEPTAMPQMVMKREEIKGSRDMDIKSCMYI